MRSRLGGIALAGGASIAALVAVLAPANAANTLDQRKPHPSRILLSLYSGSFTPAIADPRLAAEFARRGLQTDSFRFTPSAPASGKSKAVRVAIRASGGLVQPLRVSLIESTSASAVTAITPTATPRL